ncbi:MAG: hypothetical protein J7501_07290 [Bdellovibrio sp.]|nr:hypothetical protein [Bdellovibrio sp.]
MIQSEYLHGREAARARSGLQVQLAAARKNLEVQFFLGVLFYLSKSEIPRTAWDSVR